MASSGRKRRGRRTAEVALEGKASDATQAETSVKLVIPEEEFGSGVSDSVYQSLVFKEMGKLFQYERLSDVMLMAQGQSIPCHRMLLASASQYFYNKLVTEGDNLNNNLLEVEDISFPTLKLIVSYLYTGRINITAENAKDLIPACEILKLRSLLNTCERYIQDQSLINPDNCIGFYNMATRLPNATGLKEKAYHVMVSKFKEVVKGPEFKAMTEKEVIQYVQSEKLKLPNEDPVYDAVVAWVRHDIESRRSCFLNLLKHVRLRYCSPQHLHEVVSKDELMDTLECQKQLSAAALIHHSPGFTKESSGPNMMPRNGYLDASTLLLLGGISLDEGVSSPAPDYFILEEGRWCLKEGSPLRMEVYAFGACRVRDGILVTGGDKGCWLLSTSTWQWTRMPDLSVIRYGHTSVCVDETVFVIGGHLKFDDQRISICNSSVECLKLGTEHWAGLSELPKPLREPMGVAYNQYIYVLGGIALDRKASKSVFVYSINADKWNTLPETPFACDFASAVLVQDTIYVVGGANRNCLAFNLILNQWTDTLSPCQQQHIMGSAVVWKGQILICGGRSTRDDKSQEETSLIEQYDPATDMWTVAQIRLPRNLCFHHVHLVNSP